VTFAGSGDYTDNKSEKSLPFRIYSSSIDTGYIVGSGLSTFKSGLGISNIHHDSYGGETTSPMQSTFTNQHVGGNLNRHIAAGTTDPTLRPESYKIELSSGQLKIVQQSMDKPRTFCTREGLAKRAVS